MKAYLLGHSSVKGAFAVDGGSTSFLGQALKETGLSSLPNGGFDTEPLTLSNIASGATGFTIYQDPYLQGFLPTLYLYLYNISGGTIVPPDTDTGLSFITKSNYSEYNLASRYQGSTTALKYLSASDRRDLEPAGDHQHLIHQSPDKATGGRLRPSSTAALPLPARSCADWPDEPDKEADVSKMTEQGGMLLLPDGTPGPGNGTVDTLRRGLGVFGRQREATILVVTVALLLYFGLTNPTTFVSRTNAVDLFSEIAAPIAIIAVGEVLLLICGEIDLSVGFIYTLAPFIMFYLNVYYGVPALLAIILSLVFGLCVRLG